MRLFPIVLCSAALLQGAYASPAQVPQPAVKAPQQGQSTLAGAKQAGKETAIPLTLPPVPKPLLPDSFAGWVSSGEPKHITDAALADSANTAALKEYDFTDAALATYKRDDQNLVLHALRFHDASGAYGMYSFYRHDGWPKEEIGTGATSNHNRVLFWIGNTLIDATFDHISPMSGSELRELAGHISIPSGTAALNPPILNSLPQHSLNGQTTHYALGPVGYAGAGGVLPADLVGFDRGAESLTASYSLTSGPATLTLIDYPTPQMAAAQEKKIRDYIKAGNKAQSPWPKPLLDSDIASLEVRRSGPLVALISGDAIPDESHKLLATIHYESDVISVPQPMDSEASKTAQLLLGIATLVGVGGAASILLGIFLGGGRALYRLARGKPVSSLQEAEFTSLHLLD